MRPPLIPGQKRFAASLIEKVYKEFSPIIPFFMHLMTFKPMETLSQINEFINRENRLKTGVIIQIESFTSKKEIIENLECVRKMGYSTGIGLNLPTPFDALRDKMIEDADFVLLMSVSMGKGGQIYDVKATKRIMDLSKRFPNKLVEVDGGIDPEIIRIAYEAGARRFVIGSFITRSANPEDAVLELFESLKSIN